MRTASRAGLAVVVVAAATLSVNTTQAGAATTPETECHNITGTDDATQNPGVLHESAIGARKVTLSVEVHHPEHRHNVLGLHDNDENKDDSNVTLTPTQHEKGGVATAALALAAAPSSCPDSTYVFEVYDIQRRPQLLEAVTVTGAAATTDDKGRVSFPPSIFGSGVGICVNTRLVVRDPGGSVVDVEPNAGYRKVCNNAGNAGSYTG